MKAGVNFFGSGWTQNSEQAEKINSFSDLQTRGIDCIIIPLRWEFIEVSQGSYDAGVLANVRESIRLAEIYGIDVYFNIHTWYTGNGNPSYVGNYVNVFTNPSIRQAWLDMVAYVVDYFDDMPNLLGYQVFNEPVNADWGVEVGVEPWISLFQDTYNLAKQHTSKIISARMMPFADNLFDDRIFKIFDEYGINVYLDQFAGHTESNLSRQVSKAKAQGKRVQITEFGLNTGDDAAQANEFTRVLDIFKGLGVDEVYPWWYSSGTGPDDKIGYQVRDRSSLDVLESHNEENGGELRIVDFKNIGSTDIIQKIGKIVVTERDVAVPAGETVSVELQEGEFVIVGE